jgi:hypothetical protein
MKGGRNTLPASKVTKALRGSEAIMAVNMKFTVFWDVMLSCSADGYKHFRWPFCLLQEKICRYLQNIGNHLPITLHHITKDDGDDNNLKLSYSARQCSSLVHYSRFTELTQYEYCSCQWESHKLLHLFRSHENSLVSSTCRVRQRIWYHDKLERKLEPQAPRL